MKISNKQWKRDLLKRNCKTNWAKAKKSHQIEPITNDILLLNILKNVCNVPTEMYSARHTGGYPRKIPA